MYPNFQRNMKVTINSPFKDKLNDNLDSITNIIKSWHRSIINGPIKGLNYHIIYNLQVKK